MSEWDDLLTDRDRRVIANGGWGRARGLGERPALVLIDCQYNYIGDDRPTDEQQDRWPGGGGADAWTAVRRIVPVLAAARAVGVPVIYTRNVQQAGTRFDSFARKSTWDHTRTLDGHPDAEIVTELAPDDDSIVIGKTSASAFYGTPLTKYLTSLQVDTLLLCGVSTGGCVRATAVDAVTWGYRAAVLEDCVADRIEASHKIALLDMWMKYTDLVTADAAVSYLSLLKEGSHV